MKVVLVMFKDEERREFPLSEIKTIMGRRQDCHLRIPTKDVSRRHCAVLLRDNAAIAKDLGSSNGTFINEKRIAEEEIHAGDRLRLGPVTFVVQIDGEPAEIKPSDAASVGAVPEAGGTAADDEETFELSEADLDLDDPISALEELEDEKDMP